jgi:hypothetical protein
MKNNFKFISSGLILVALFSLVFVSCKKQELVIPDQKPFFINASGSYRITAANQTFKIPVGITSVSNSERKVTVSVTSPTGAQAGTHYNLPSNVVTIPAGKAIDSLPITAVLSQYQSGRKDTLIFSITDADRSPNLKNNYVLVISGPCFEGDVNLNTLLGEYKNTNEDFGGAYGPYTTRVTAVSQASPTATTGTITVANIYDNGWNPITFNLDWTDATNRKVTVTQQTGIGNAGTVNPAYDGQDLQVRAHSNGQIGTFSICNQTITIRMQVGVTGLGWFGTMYTVTMAR